jgi:CBF1 interacting corepressor
MVAGLKFLSKKSFNPQNLTNQKRVWERQERTKQEEKRVQQRARQLQRERDDEELAKSRGDQPKLAFLYKPPPGLEGKANPNQRGPAVDLKETPAAHTETGRNDFVERQPGDNDAAAAFRQMLATAATPNYNDDNASNDEAPFSTKTIFGTVLQGTSVEATREKKTMSALEKAVGRNHDKNTVTLDEQIQRFPALANAPRVKGVDETSSAVQFKPLGTQIRNVRCLKCGVWGHSRGDRECELSGWNPFNLRGSAPSATSIMPKKAVDKDGKSVEKETSHRAREERYSHSDECSSSSDTSEENRRRRKYKRRKQERRSSVDKQRHKSYNRKRSHRDDADVTADSDKVRRRRSRKQSRRDDSGRRNGYR